MKDLYKTLKVKFGTATKAIHVGRLLSQWLIGLFVDSEDESAPSVLALKPCVVDELAQLPSFESVSAYTYFVESKNKSYDKESLWSFKSLKGYRYFNNGFVQNVWIHELPTGKYLYLRCYCFALLTNQEILHHLCVRVARELFIRLIANANQDLGKPVVTLLLSCSSLKTSSAKGYQQYQKMSPAREHGNSGMFHQREMCKQHRSTQNVA